MRVFIKMPLKTHRKIWESDNFISCSKYIAKELLKFYSKRNSISVVETDSASLNSHTQYAFPQLLIRKVGHQYRKHFKTHLSLIFKWECWVSHVSKGSAIGMSTLGINLALWRGTQNQASEPGLLWGTSGRCFSSEDFIWFHRVVWAGGACLFDGGLFSDPFLELQGSIAWCVYKDAAAAKSLQSCLTLCDPTDGSPPGSPVPGILQARTPEWVAISFSNAWKWKVKVKSLSRVRPSGTPWTSAFQAPPSMGFSRQEYWSGVPLPSPYRCWW